MSRLALVAGSSQRGGRLLRFTTVIKHFDATLGRFELGVTVARELDAPLEQVKRLFERLVAVLELLDELLELSQCRFEIAYRGVRQVNLLTSQLSSPR